MAEFFTWLSETQPGMWALLGSLFVLFILVAVIYEIKTRKMFPDTNRRAKKAAREAAEEAAEESGTDA